MSITHRVLFGVLSISLVGVLPAADGTTSSSNTSAPASSTTEYNVFPERPHAVGDDLKNVTRISAEELDRQFTATDLIGATVNDRDGRAIGKVVDLAFGRSALQQSQGNESSTTADASAAPADRATSAPGQPVVFVEVDEAGAGAGEYVRIPLSALSYDAEQDSLELIVDPSELAQTNPLGTSAMTQREASPAAPTGLSASVDAGTGAATTAAKQQWENDARLIRSAMRSDGIVSSFVPQVRIDESEWQLIVEGTVNTEMQKERLIAITNANTEKVVVDRVNVVPRH